MDSGNAGWVLLSVIVPVYDDVCTIAELPAGVARELVVDDCSTDGTAKARCLAD